MPWIVIDGAAYKLKTGQLSLGRSPRCDIFIADTLASRHHATFLTEGDRVSVRDTGSRNGTMLNGKILVGSRVLSHLDRIVIGTTQILFYATNPTSSDLTPMMSIAPPQQLSDPGPELDVIAETQATSTLTGTGHMVVGALVARSLDANDLETAGRIIQNLAQRMMVGARGRSLPARDLLACGDIVMRFADVTRDTRWVEWMLNIHTVMVEIPSRYSVDVICALGSELTTPNAPRAWLAVVRDLNLTAEQRFLVSRIEGLERQLSA